MYSLSGSHWHHTAHVHLYVEGLYMWYTYTYLVHAMYKSPQYSVTSVQTQAYAVVDR